MSELLTTPLYDWHCEAGARMVPFAGYQMPVRYGSQVDEHHAVRRAAGLFDVSHMGEFVVRGPGAVAFVQKATPNNVERLAEGRAHYSALLDEQGRYLDDLLVYRRAPDELLLVVNAAGCQGDLRHLECLASAWDGEPFELIDESDRWALIALQGPKALDVLRAAFAEAGGLVDLVEDGEEFLGRLADLGYYRFLEAPIGGRDAIWSRTGYTGEFGFELYVASDDAVAVWRALIDAGSEHGLLPAGLGARDTLRLEAGMHLSGQDLGPSVTPLDVGLGWTVKFKAGDFVGRDALVAQRNAGPTRRLVGFELTERGIARTGDAFVVVTGEGEERTGTVTSGTWSPTLEKAIGLALIEGPEGFPAPEIGAQCRATVRNRVISGEIVEVPFYRAQS